MLNVFVKKSAEELHVELSDGRMMPLEDLVKDYERLLKEKTSKNTVKSKPKDDKSTVSKLKVGEWFRIDREVIDKSKEEIHRKCNEVGEKGKTYWKRFEEANKIANEHPDQYPRLIETYIFEHNWEYKTEQEMRGMCKEVGEGMCDEVICDLELQMRICNGESADDLFKKADKLPRKRVIQFREGGIGYFGGGADDNYYDPPAHLFRNLFAPLGRDYGYVPYAFRRVLS